MSYLPGSGYPVGGVIQASDDRIGYNIPGELESQVEVFGVWGENGGGVTGSPSIDTAC